MISPPVILTVMSDIHFAGSAEVAMGHPRMHLTSSRWRQFLMRHWDRWIWMRDPLAHNGLVDDFLEQAPNDGWVVANGDFSLDSACVGLSDPAAFASAAECVGKLRQRLGTRLLATIGDHELGKVSAVGNKGGLRLASWHSTTGELALKSFWRQPVGNLVLMGVTSSLVGLELLRPDALTTEWDEWQRLRQEHRQQIASAFAALSSEQRVVLFCHDPSALPFLMEIPEVASRLDRIERTIVGHLHSRVVFSTCRLLAGVPPVKSLGTTLRRWTTALHRVAAWRPFKPMLCPSLAGIELVGRGGWLELKLNPDSGRITDARLRTMPRRRNVR
jgi:hypothetical protein